MGLASRTGLLDAAPMRPSSPCLPTPAQEEGPYYIPAERVRRDITEGRPGVPLRLELRLLSERTCEPIRGASFDVWHCDALGVYSGYTALAGPPPGGGPPRGGPPGGGPPSGRPPGAGRPAANAPTNKATFLRGVALTDHQGVARFTTIFPGFYEGRVNHVHVKIRPARALDATAATHVSYTGQIFFAEAVAREISQREPYANHHIERTALRDDRVFMTESGSASVAKLQKHATQRDGYTALLDFHIDPFARPGYEWGV